MAYPDHPGESADVLLAWRANGVAHLRFNRPKALNAIDVAMARAFHEACRAIAADEQVRAVCLSGEGRAFMAGGDLAAMREDPQGVAQQLIDGMHGGLRLLAQLKAPVVASVHGAVAGGGLGVALGCDLVIAAEGTKFGIAYPGIGASCDCSTSWGLPRIVGVRKAMELAFLGENFDAAQALELGIVNRVVPAAELAGATEALVQRLAQGPTQAYGHLKRLLRASLQNDLDTHLDAEAAGFRDCAGTQDFREGVAAFFDKRPPVFQGR